MNYYGKGRHILYACMHAIIAQEKKKFADKNFSQVRAGGEIGENFLLVKTFGYCRSGFDY